MLKWHRVLININVKPVGLLSPPRFLRDANIEARKTFECQPAKNFICRLQSQLHSACLLRSKIFAAAGRSTLFSWIKRGPTNNGPPQTEFVVRAKQKSFLEDFPAINQVVTLTLIHIICQYNERRKLLINKDLILRQKIVWFALIATTKAANLGQQMAIGMIYVRNNLRFEVGETTLGPPFPPPHPQPEKVVLTWL